MIQIAFVKWGTRYGASTINRHVRAILEHATCDVKFVCITDRADPDIDARVETRGFPPFVAPMDYLKIGCRLKLSIFADGVLDPDLPTVFFDLDTMICGDVNRLREHVESKGGISMLQNHFLQWWPYQHLARRFSPECYYFANSSVIGFKPREYGFLYDAFNQQVVDALPSEEIDKKYHSDERFISYNARETLRVFPNNLVVKFAEEFMTPHVAMEETRRLLPWVSRRREQLVAITFVSEGLKPDQLVKLKRGDVIRYKHVAAKWNHETFSDYWRETVTAENSTSGD
ncbi:MAG: hypothetical protein AAF989_02180 [Planctomycetota bacterium]